MERQPPWADQQQDAKEIEHWGRKVGATPLCVRTREAVVRPVSGQWCESGRGGAEGFRVVLDVPFPKQGGTCGCLLCDNPLSCCVWLCCKLSFHVIVFPHFQMKTRTVHAMRHPAGSTVLASPCSAPWRGPHPPQTTCMGVGADMLGAAGGSCSFFPGRQAPASSSAVGVAAQAQQSQQWALPLTPSLSISPGASSSVMLVRPISHCSLV